MVVIDRSFAIWPSRFPLFFARTKRAHAVVQKAHPIGLILVTNTRVYLFQRRICNALDESSSLRRVPFPVPCKYFNKGFSFRISTPPITLSLPFISPTPPAYSICRPPISCISHISSLIILYRDATNEKVAAISPVSYSRRFC